jgi:transposase
MATATRNDECTMNRSNTSDVLYLAFELSVDEWKLGFTRDLGAKPRVRVMPARDLKRLAREIAAARQWFALSEITLVRSCYEAGRDGFWLHRYLATVGIDNRVIDSSSIEVNRRQRRAKSDGLDVRKLLAMLVRYHAGESKVWSVVRVPTVEEEDRRQLHRELRTLKKERTRVKNRMQGLLANHGLRLSKGRDLTALLEEMRLWDGSPLPAGLRARLQREWEHAQFLHAKILELERERQRAIKHDRSPAIDKVRQLLRLRAIGENGAWVYVNEFFGWRQFRNRKEVGAAAGLTPTPYQSGDSSRERGVSKAGSRHIRAVAIEMAWCWLRYQPGSRLSRWYQERFERGGTRARKVGIVALARKLLIDLWRFLEHGVIPEGAVLKP